MLDSGVEYTSHGSNGIDCGYDLIKKHFFSFKVPYSKGIEKYTVEFHEYKYSMFVGKYYPTRFSKDKDKFALIFQENRGVRFTSIVLRTVQNIFLHVFRKYPKASFGFIGEPRRVVKTPKKAKGYKIIQEENIDETKRYQLYRKICLRDIGIENFSLLENKEKSAIILINNCNGDIESYRDKITKMMMRNYSALEI